MNIFEFQFNPKTREEEIYQTFLFEPTNVLERKLGSLYLVGHLSKALPQNFRFLEKLSNQIKKKYYALSAYSSEKALRETLAKTNEFLADEVQRGNVSWLGNLNLGVFSLKDYIFNFTLAARTKVFLLRGGKIMDIGKNLELEEMEPWPLKIFGNIVSGKLSDKDKILILTKEISDFFNEQGLIKEIAKIDQLEEKRLKTLFKSKEKLFAEISGILLIIDLSQGVMAKEKIAFEKKFPSLSIWQIFSPIQNFLSRIRLPSLPRLTLQIQIPRKIPRLPRVKLKSTPNLKRNLFFILFLVLILVLGGIFARVERNKEIKTTKEVLENAQWKVEQAQRALTFKDKNEANRLYQEAWQEISAKIKPGNPLEKDVSQLKGEIEAQLFTLNQLEKITEPESLFDFQDTKFIPEKIISLQGNLYFFSPAIQDLYQLNIKDKKGDFIKTDQKFSLATPLENTSLLFYLRPDLLFPLKDNQLTENLILKIPYQDFYLNSFTSYKSNLYFLDSKSGEIVKFLFREGERELSGSLWLDSKTEKLVGAKSISVDGSLWVLNNDNSIHKLYAGKIQSTLKLDFFPYPKNISKILTSERLPYLYLLEPSQNRIVIIDKSGGVIKQFQSDKFDNLKDFSVSENGKIIYLLNGLKVYKISF